MKKVTLFLLYSMLPANVFALDVNLNLDLNEAKTIKAKKIEYNVKTENVKTSGDTEIVNRLGEKVTADKLEYNAKTEIIKASGNAELTNAEGQRVKSKTFTATKDRNNIDAKDIELWLGSHVYLRADEIKRKNEETIAQHAEFTACDGCDSYGNAWEIFARTTIHDAAEKMLYFHSASFWVYNDTFPIFWLPYYEMPDPSVKYKSGILSPSFNSTHDMGTQFNIPVYINFSDRHDLTTTFSYLTRENPLLQVEHRLNLTHSEFRTKGSFTHTKTGENRWHIYNDDKIELGENARALIYIARTSDKAYLRKYNLYDYQPYLDSGAKLELFGQAGYVVADTHIFQELRQPRKNQNYIPGDILPNIRGVYQTDPFWHATYLSFSGDILSISGDKTSNQRISGNARIISPWTLWGGNRLTFSASTRYDVYNFEKTVIYNDGLRGAENNSTTIYSGMKTRFLPSAYVEWGLPMYDTKNSWTYVLEPRARLTIMEHNDKKAIFAQNNDSNGHFLSDTSLFSDNRFAGLDLWENSNFVDYGARWAAFNKNHNIEVFFGQTYDFNNKDDYDNGFRRGFSDYVGRISYEKKYFQIASRFRLDRENMSVNHTENSVYLGKSGTYITLGHIWDSRPIDLVSSTDNYDIHELSTGVGLKLTKRLKIQESVIYNLTEHVTQRHAGGIYYEHPCYHFELTYKRDNSLRQNYSANTTYHFKFGISIDGKHY